MHEMKMTATTDNFAERVIMSVEYTPNAPGVDEDRLWFLDGCQPMR
jgi:hypothetical protein